MTTKIKSGLLLLALFATSLSTRAEEAQPSGTDVAAAPALAETDFKTETHGQFQLSADRDSPLFAEFQNSTALTERLRSALTERGFRLVDDPKQAKTVLSIHGDVTLRGGKAFQKGVKVSIGDATERALRAAKESGQLTSADIVQPTASVAINAAGYAHSVGPFMKGLYLGNMASAIGDATGVSGWFNNKLTGDPRGICLSKCEDWNKVTQTAYLWASAQSQGGDKREVRVLTRVISETLAPEQVVVHAVGKAIQQIDVDAPSTVVLTSSRGTN